MPTDVRVVLDTNVIISALLAKDGNPARIFELFLNGTILNYTSKEILDEIREVLSRPHFAISLETQSFVMNALENYSIIITPESKIHAVDHDPDDNKFIDCALSAKAVIISGDNHLLKLKKCQEVYILSPREFLNQYLPSQQRNGV